MEQATFGAGCFWGVEEKFRKRKGIIDTKVGYSGGNFQNPSYENVCTGETGHAEVVQLSYDEKQISYEELLTIFFSIHNPTTKNRQGFDTGSQYRSVIFYHNKEQKQQAVIFKENLDKAGKYEQKTVTEIEPYKIFYKAEEYHQCYFEKHGGGCH
jgi:peptide-methionine (S)-S-oxide reductase